MLKKKLEELRARRIEIRSSLELDQKIDMATVQEELNQLEVREADLLAKMELAELVHKTENRSIEKPKMEFKKKEYDEVKEYRSAFFKKLMNKQLSEMETRAMDTTVGSAGYAIPESLSQLIYRAVETQSILYTLVKKTFVKGTFSVLTAPASADVSWHVENNAETSDDTVIPVKVTFNGYELIKIIDISKAALTMTIDSFEAYIATEIGIKMSRAIEAAVISGNGATAPKGILTEALTEVNFTGAIDYTTLVTALGTLPGQYASGASFSMNRKTFYTEVLGIVDADGNPVVIADVQSPAKFNILGVPVVIADQIADSHLILGNLNYYQINYQEGVSIEKDVSVGFKSGYVTFRGYALLDGKVLDTDAFILIEEA